MSKPSTVWYWYCCDETTKKSSPNTLQKMGAMGAYSGGSLLPKVGPLMPLGIDRFKRQTIIPKLSDFFFLGGAELQMVDKFTKSQPFNHLILRFRAWSPISWACLLGGWRPCAGSFPYFRGTSCSSVAGPWKYSTSVRENECAQKAVSQTSSVNMEVTY